MLEPCHGAGPGYVGGLALLKCDAVGNAQRLLAARPGRGSYVTADDPNSELVLRLMGQGFPQMPAGGVPPGAAPGSAELDPRRGGRAASRMETGHGHVEN